MTTSRASRAAIRDHSLTATEAEPAAMRERMLLEVFEAARGLTWGEDWNHGNAAVRHGYRRRLLVAVGRAGKALGAHISPQAESAADLNPPPNLEGK
jgi:hypothetical protein